MNRLVLYIVFLSSFLSCKKDKLIDDKDIFVGKWKLAYIVEVQYGQNSAGTWESYDTIWASEMSDNYFIDFREQGKVCLLRDDKKLDCGRTVFYDFSIIQNTIDLTYNYKIRLNGKVDDVLFGTINQDTLLALKDGFPYESPQNFDSGGKYFKGYYLRN
ncbi:MAG: hypothetical protein EP333_06865 [Bacteroidetes bacterium]|nr:MAG: hypothetical protein EP333_06865 [Bacteroidota bacterium]